MNGVVAGCEVDINRYFAGEEDGEVGDHAAFAWWEQDADAFFLGLFFDLRGEGDGSA